MSRSQSTTNSALNGEPVACRQDQADESNQYRRGHHVERPELRRAGPTSVNRAAKLETPSRVACSDLLGIIGCVYVLLATDETR